MPNADLILPGFYGKLPAAGDFVARRLPLDFVQAWDRWLAKHIAPLIGPENWSAGQPLRFISGPNAFGPAVGIVAASRDRVGRRFPLSLVALPHTVSIGLAGQADAWFLALEDAAAAAQDGLSPDELDLRLSTLGFAPEDDDDSEPIDAMIVWTARSDLYDVDPDAPEAVLNQLFAHKLETS